MKRQKLCVQYKIQNKNKNNNSNIHKTWNYITNEALNNYANLKVLDEKFYTIPIQFN